MDLGLQRKVGWTRQHVPGRCQAIEVSHGRSITDATKKADCSSSFRIHGFIVGDLEKKYSEYFYSTIPKALGNGEIKFAEVKYDGLDKAPQAMIDLLAGKQGGGEGLGKVVIEIK